MSKDLIMATLSNNGIRLPEGADVFAVYQEQIAANTIAPIDGVVLPRSEEALSAAYRYSFLHWGISVWATYSFSRYLLGVF